MKLQKKIAIITGGGSGIGRCVAHELAALGAHVLLSGRSADKLERVAAEVAECHRQAGRRFIVGAGCEVPRDTPIENLRALCAYALSQAP